MSESQLNKSFDALRAEVLVTEDELRAMLSAAGSKHVAYRDRINIGGWIYRIVLPTLAAIVGVVAIAALDWGATITDESTSFAGVSKGATSHAQSARTLEARRSGMSGETNNRATFPQRNTQRLNHTNESSPIDDRIAAHSISPVALRHIERDASAIAGSALNPSRSATRAMFINEIAPESESEFSASAGLTYGIASHDTPDLNDKLTTAGFAELPPLMNRVGVQGTLQYKRWMLGVEYLPAGTHEVERMFNGAQQRMSFSNQRTSFIGGYIIPVGDALDLTFGYKFSLNRYEMRFSNLRPATESSSPTRSENDEWDYMWRDLAVDTAAHSARTLYKHPFTFSPSVSLAWRAHRYVNLQLGADWALHQRTTWADSATDRTVHGAVVGMELDGITVRGGVSVMLTPFD